MPGAAADDIARSRDVSLVLPDKPSVAVLPFTNMSADREQEYFSDGITEDIITELSRIRGFLVIARNTTFVYKGRAVDVKQIGRELGVRYVLEGSVRKAGAQLRVTAQLIEAETNRHLWAERYDGPADDVFAIQDRITRSVVGCIAPELFVAEHERARRKPTHSLDAWECQVRALFLCNQQSRDATDRAIQLMERALALDPHYAQAHGLRAWVAIWRAFQGWEPMDRAIRIAGSEIALAQALASDEPWSLLAQAMVGFALRDNQLSVAAAERATHSSPNMAYAHGLLGVAHAFGGRPEQAIACVDHSVRLRSCELICFSRDWRVVSA